MKTRTALYLYLLVMLAFSAACSAPPPAALTGEPPSPVPSVAETREPRANLPTDDQTNGTATTTVTSTSSTDTAGTATELIPVTSHLMRPGDTVPAPRKLIDDAESSGTGPEGRAPYGDSYKLNRFERPFLEDMAYVPDLDIHRFGLSEDGDWYYVTIQLIGSDPNHARGINYGAEIDLNLDGFGDTIIWAHPPYTTEWETGRVQIFQDSNLDSGGLSAVESDAVNDGDGYETLVFDGSSSENSDPDLAWVRLDGNQAGVVQFAFKKALTGPAFSLGVVADAGLKDVTKYDYADHISLTDAGSPVQGNLYFPLKSLFAVDNTCWEAYGIQTTGFEPKICQPILQPVNTPSKDACDPPPDCGGGPFDPETCLCT